MTKWLLLTIVMVLTLSVWAGPRDRAQVEQEITLLNTMIEIHRANWKADMTCVSMLSDEEIQGMLGLIPGEVSREEFVFNAADWPGPGQVVLVPNITEVKNQKQCGSCVAFGTTAVFEQTYWTKNNLKKLFSERYLFFCSPYAGYGCNNGWSLNGGAVAASKSTKGMIEHDNCKYFDGTTFYYDCGSGCNTNVAKYTMPYRSISASSYINVLNSGKAIIIGMIVFNDFRYYSSGVYEHLEGQQLGGHCMALVGYGTSEEGKHFWVIKNSWSESWGNKGYIYIMIKPEQKYQDSNVEDYGGYYFE